MALFCSTHMSTEVKADRDGMREKAEYSA
jgi:hypothetical protein